MQLSPGSSAPAFLLFGLVVACSTPSSSGSGGGSSDGDGDGGGGSGAGTAGEACANPLECGCSPNRCAPDETCSECVQAYGRGHRCNAEQPVLVGQFDCGWTACVLGKDMCVVDEPHTDGCFGYHCLEAPAKCQPDPTCACVEAEHIPGIVECTEHPDGTLVLVDNQ